MDFLFEHWRLVTIVAAVAALVLVVVNGQLRNARNQRSYRLPAAPAGQPRGGMHDSDAPSLAAGGGWHGRDDVWSAAVRDNPGSGDGLGGSRDRPPTPRPPHLAARQGGEGDTVLRSELLQLGNQVEQLEQNFTSTLQALESRIARVEQRQEGSGDTTDSASSIARDLDRTFRSAPDSYQSSPIDGVMSQPLSLRGGGGGREPQGSRVPVELNGTEVCVTHSIPPEAWLVPQGGGIAQVSLNPEVAHPRYSLDRLATFFDLGDRREGAYVTRAPAEVSWDDREQRGSLRRSGKAVAQ